MSDKQDKRQKILSVVVIGLNEETRLKSALEAVLGNCPDGWVIELLYVDSGSTDNSVKIAEKNNDVTVIHLQDDAPSAAKGRNVGLREISGAFVQLLDGDSVLQPDWLEQGINFLENNDDVSCVFGHCLEMYPESNIYMRVCSFDWHIEPGDARYCGGNAMWRRKEIQAAGLFDEDLRLGEEPDLCYRVRQEGGRIVCLDQPMVKHDLAMNTFSDYWKRAENSGRAYVRVAMRYWDRKEKLWLYESVRNLVDPLLWILIFITGLWLYGLGAAVFGLLIWLILRVFRTTVKTRPRAKSWKEAMQYAIHTQVVKLPIIVGQAKSLFGR